MNADTYVIKEGDSIQTAIDAASAGDRVILKPAIYKQRVRIESNIPLVAPDGAVLNGSSLSGDGAAVIIQDGAVPVIGGITITSYSVGVNAEGTSGNWVLQNVTLTGASHSVEASRTTGDWAVRRSTIHRANKD